jgi:hypothetical protein
VIYVITLHLYNVSLHSEPKMKLKYWYSIYICIAKDTRVNHAIWWRGSIHQLSQLYYIIGLSLYKV